MGRTRRRTLPRQPHMSVKLLGGSRAWGEGDSQQVRLGLGPLPGPLPGQFCQRPAVRSRRGGQPRPDHRARCSRLIYRLQSWLTRAATRDRLCGDSFCGFVHLRVGVCFLPQPHFSPLPPPPHLWVTSLSFIPLQKPGGLSALEKRAPETRLCQQQRMSPSL